MSKELNGPPGSPVALCSGTGMTLMMVYAPFTVVPQVGQFFVVPQPLAITNSAVRRIVRRILGLIRTPPAISLQDQLAASPTSVNPLTAPSANQHPRGLPLKPELQLL